MNLILVIHHVFKMGVKFDFQFFEKIIVGEYQVEIFLNSPCDSIGKTPYEIAQLGKVAKNLYEPCLQQTVIYIMTIFFFVKI